MESAENHTAVLERWLTQMRDGDSSIAEDARSHVIEHAAQRLELLTRRMLKRNTRLRRWEETGDVVQSALLRLHRSLETIKPQSPREFYGLAATQIRRELIDLARHHFGPEGAAAKHQTDALTRSEGAAPGILENQSDSTAEPATLAEWTEFHELIERLPEAERDVFNLLWYEGLTQVEAAAILGVTDRTVKSRWREAKLSLRTLLDGGSLP